MVGAAADPRAGAAQVSAACLAVGSPPVRTWCSCPAAASAGAAVAASAAAGSAGAAVDCDAVVVAVVGDGRVVAAAVVLLLLLLCRKLLLNLPDSAAVAGVDGVGAVEFLEHS